MTLTRALANANTGLAAATLQASVASNNIANASTPGYVRRTVLLGENVVAGQGAGVNIVDVTRNQDFALTAERRQAQGAAARADVIATSYVELNAALGEPEDGFGMFAAYTSFEDALRELAITPESPPLQNNLYAASAELVQEFNRLSSLVNRQRVDADNAIADSVQTINQSLNEIQNLNVDLASGGQSPGDRVALEDQRQRLVDEIAEFIPVKQIRNDDGTIDLITNEGVFLIAGTVQELSFEPAGIIPEGATFGDGSNVLSGLFVGSQEVTPETNATFSLQSGKLSGYFAVRDNISPGFINQIDAMAGDLVSRFSDPTADPTLTGGAPGVFTDEGNALDPTNIAGLAGRLELNAAVDPTRGGLVSRFRDGVGATTAGAAGDSTTLNNLLDAFTAQNTVPADTNLVGELSATGIVAGVNSFIGGERIRAEAVQTSSSTRAEILLDSEVSKTAVDTDKELQSLLLIEQAYAANARVIQVVGDMINRLLEL